MNVEIKFSDAGLRTFIAKAQSLTQANGEIARGLNEAGDRVRTIVRHRLQAQTGVLRYGIITDETSSRQATPGHLVYTITGTGKGLPIRDFAVRAAAGGPVTADVWGVPHTFARSFVTRIAGKLRARRGSARMPIRSLRGPSIAKEIVKGETLAAFDASVVEIVRPLVLTRLLRLVS